MKRNKLIVPQWFRCGIFIHRREMTMTAVQKSESIKAGLRKGFQDGNSKMACRKCHGYEVGSAGELAVNSDEANIMINDCFIIQWE